MLAESGRGGATSFREQGLSISQSHLRLNYFCDNKKSAVCFSRGVFVVIVAGMLISSLTGVNGKIPLKAARYGAMLGDVAGGHRNS